MAMVCVAVAAVAFVAPARADDTIKTPGDHPKYAVEIEPHVLLGWHNVWPGSGGFGLGGRFSIPVVENGFIPSINNSVAVGFGIDWVHYEGCYFRGRCVANYFYFPVVMQWNFFVAKNFSAFGEPGILLYYGTFDDCDPNDRDCREPSRFGPSPALFIGGRYHFNEKVALTFRIGYPAFSFGVSFF